VGAIIATLSDHDKRAPMLDPVSRRKIEAVPLCGPKTADYLEMIGIKSFEELAQADARDLKLRINAHLGRPHINEMGVRALANLIATAQQQQIRGKG
jgi:predicted flap endonuclease-1-like 5' DNA nuclease